MEEEWKSARLGRHLEEHASRIEEANRIGRKAKNLLRQKLALVENQNKYLSESLNGQRTGVCNVVIETLEILKLWSLKY